MLVGDCTTDDLKKLIVETLNLDAVTPDMIDEGEPLFGEGLGLDSVDALELVVAIEKTFQVRIVETEDIQKAFHSVSTLSEYIRQLRSNSEHQEG